MQYERKVFNRYLTEPEERQLFSTVRQFGDILARRDYAWMRWMRQTGIRVGAASRFTCADARDALREGYLTVRGAINKGGRTSKTYLNKKGRQALKDLLAIRREQGHPEIPDQPLVMSRRGAGLSVRSFQARMVFWREKADLDGRASPHWFRHTLSKRIMKRSTAEDPRGVVQVVLDHASINSTAVYSQPDKEDIAAAMEEAS